MPDRAVVIHCWAHACAALAAAAACDRPVLLLSARGAAAYAGAGWFAALVREARAEFPTVEFAAMLDCARRPDLVQAAFREGLQDVCFHGSAAVARRLAEIARHWDARLHRRRPAALDLLDEPRPEEACRRWLSVAAKTRRARLTRS
jgi:fructose/tagatose bisphosphate aldolase